MVNFFQLVLLLNGWPEKYRPPWANLQSSQRILEEIGKSFKVWLNQPLYFSESACSAGDRVQSLGQKDPLEKGWESTPVFLSRESHGQRSLTGYSLWSRKESDVTERLTPPLLLLYFSDKETKIQRSQLIHVKSLNRSVEVFISNPMCNTPDSFTAKKRKLPNDVEHLYHRKRNKITSIRLCFRTWIPIPLCPLVSREDCPLERDCT